MKSENPIGSRRQLRGIETGMRERYRAQIAEREFLSQVRELAGYLGWRCYHTHDSRRSESGFPDLCLVRSPRLIFAELKTDAGRASDAQGDWLNDLGRVPNVETYIWRPADLEMIRRTLAKE